MATYKLVKPRKSTIQPIGTVIKSTRLKKNISLYRLSKQTKIPYSTLKSMEDSGKTANFDYVIRICKALNEPIETFMEERRSVIG